MKHQYVRAAGIAAVAGALALPASASAASTVFTTTGKAVPAGQTATPSWTQSDLQSETQYLVSNNGFTLSLRESNGRTTGGALAYAALPSAYRNLIPKSRWLAEGDTGAQPHATCRVPSLDAQDVVLGWQGDEPSYGYIPFQATSAGLGDDPATWLPKVKAATGLTLTPTTDLAAACTGLGGTFAPADQVIATSDTFAAGLIAPLNDQIRSLTAAKKASDDAKAAADAARKAAEADVKRLTLEAQTFKISVNSAATLQRGLDVDVVGPPNRGVLVRVQFTEQQRKKFKLKYKTLGLGAGVTDAKGKVRVVAQPREDTAPFLLDQAIAIPVIITATSGDRSATIIQALGGRRR